MNKYLKQAMLIGLLGLCQVVGAQTAAPSTQQMIEQLKAPPQTGGFKTRGMRNLSVEATTDSPSESPAAAAAPTVRPSLSLLIQFDFNSSQIKPESQQSLMNLAEALKSPELVSSNFAVEGHTDAKGSADYNLKLSQQRADAVQKFLVTRGVAPGRLMAAGKGSTQLANASDPLAAENRRVRIVNLN